MDIEYVKYELELMGIDLGDDPEKLEYTKADALMAAKLYLTMYKDYERIKKVGSALFYFQRFLDDLPLTSIKDGDLWIPLSLEYKIDMCSRYKSLIRNRNGENGRILYTDQNRIKVLDFERMSLTESDICQAWLDANYPIVLPYLPRKEKCVFYVSVNKDESIYVKMVRLSNGQCVPIEKFYNNGDFDAEEITEEEWKSRRNS